MRSATVRSIFTAAVLATLPATSAFASGLAGAESESPADEATLVSLAQLAQEDGVAPETPERAYAPQAPAASVDESVAPARRTRTITVNPLALAFGAFNAEFETATSPNMTFFIGPSYFSSSVTSDGDTSSVSAFGIDTGLRFFTQPNAPEGFWVGPAVQLAYATADGDGSSASSALFGIGGLLGYTWITTSGFDFSLGIGGMYRHFESESSSGSTVSLSGMGLAARLSLGFAF